MSVRKLDMKKVQQKVSTIVSTEEALKSLNENDKLYNDEVTKGRMKISRTEVPTKSKHKHDYYPVLILSVWDNRNHYDAGVKCSICGKVKTDWDNGSFNKLTDTTFPLQGFLNNYKL